MSEIVCPACGVLTECVEPPPERVVGGKVLTEHSHPSGSRCWASNGAVREASPPSDCPTCGCALSLAVRSRAALLNRRHRPDECIVELRCRIEALEAREP